MSSKRPYPESYQTVHHRAPRVAQLGGGRIAVLSEPGFEAADEVRLHLCDATRASEGLPQPGLTLVGPEGATFPCAKGARLVTGIWCDSTGRLLLAWSDGQQVLGRRSHSPVADLASLSSPTAWEPLFTAPSVEGAEVHLGSGQLDPGSPESLWVASLELPSGQISLVEAGATPATVHAHPLNHTPSLAFDPNGDAIHVVWDTDDLRILYRRIAVADLRAGTVPAEEPLEVWWFCHHPDVATNGREVIVAFTDHMHNIKYGYFDGREWQRNLFLTALHPRFSETIEHSPWLWTDAHGLVHLSFVCLTRRLVYDAVWLGEGFAEPQPVEGLFHPSLFNDDMRVPAERMSLDQRGGAFLLSSTFLPERHGTYASHDVPTTLKPDQPVLFLDMAEVAELRGLIAKPVTMRDEPATPVFEPTGRWEDFDGARVLNNGTVLKDGGRYRTWYSSVALDTEPALNWYDQVYVGYAESDDGVCWRRTDTGLGHSFRDRPAPNFIKELDHNACVFIDPEDEPSRRYKAIKFESRAQRYDRVKRTGELGYLGLPRRGWLCTSPDGLRWQREEVTVDFPGPEPYGFQPQTALYDAHDPDPNRRYKAIGFTSMVSRRRGANLAYSADCRHWTVAERSPVLDSMAAVTPVRPAGPYAQIHDASMARYGRYLFAFYGYQFDGESADTRLAVSRDNERFTFVYPETSLVALGEPGSWNSAYMMPVDLVVEDEEMWLYYGCSASHTSDESSGMPEWRVCGGRAVVRRDGFVEVSPREAGQCGRLVTIPFEVEETGALRLDVNAKLTEGSALRVGLTEAGLAGAPIPGFRPTDCYAITGDSVRHPVRWRGSEILPTDMRRFRIQLELEGCPDDALYSVALRKG